MKLKTKVCPICGKEFIPEGRQKWCLDCKKQAKKEYDKQYRIRNDGRWPKELRGRHVYPIKICASCGGEFRPIGSSQKWCSVCRKLGAKAHSLRLEKYGMTREQYAAMLEAQNGKCAVCGASVSVHISKYGVHSPLCIDHDHKTGKVRGLLCNNCNSALGHAHDNPDILLKLVAYLNCNE